MYFTKFTFVHMKEKYARIYDIIHTVNIFVIIIYNKVLIYALWVYEPVQIKVDSLSVTYQHSYKKLIRKLFSDILTWI